MLIHRIPPKGATNPSKAKAAAASDGKQRTLGFAWVLTPKLPIQPVRAAPTPAPPPAPSPTPTAAEDLAFTLEMSDVMHSIVDRTIALYQSAPSVIDMEVKSVLDDLIDRVQVNSGNTIQSVLWLKPRRSQYSSNSRARVVGLAEGAESPAAIVKRLKKVSGYEKVTPTMVKRWRTAGPNKKRGKKVNAALEQQILGQMIYTEFEEVNGVEVALVKANISHSYAVIQAAAKIAQALPQFAADDKIKNLMFSRPWVKGFLKRAALRRRRVTASEKILPPPTEVRARMEAIQSMLADYDLEETISADETGIFFGAPPKNQYIPESAARATAPESDDKARFTSLLWGTAAGWMGPSFTSTSSR